MKRAVVSGGILAVLLAGPVLAFASQTATTDPGQIAAFQAGATIETFEAVPGIVPFNNVTPGTAVPTAAFLKNQIADLRFFSNEFQGPYVADLTGLANSSDAHSGHNVVVGTEPDGVVCPGCFVEVTFASPVSRVGAFTAPSGGGILMLATDISGNTTFETVQGTGGQFVGADTGTNNIQRALFIFTNVNTFNSLDDLTYARAGTTTVPEPGTFVVIGAGLVGLAWLRRRRPGR